MDLKARHVPAILLGGVVGAGVGWGIVSALKAVGLADVDALAGFHSTGPIFGAVGGVGVAVIAVLVRAVRDPNVPPPSNFTQINGMGSVLIGRSDKRDDGSYVTTEWFTVLWLPVFPVCRYRLTEREEASGVFYREYDITEKHPPRLADAVRVYGIEVVAIGLIAGVACLAFR